MLLGQTPVRLVRNLRPPETVLAQDLLLEKAFHRVRVDAERLGEGLDGGVQLTGAGVELATVLSVSMAKLRT